MAIIANFTNDFKNHETIKIIELIDMIHTKMSNIMTWIKTYNHIDD